MVTGLSIDSITNKVLKDCALFADSQGKNKFNGTLDSDEFSVFCDAAIERRVDLEEIANVAKLFVAQNDDGSKAKEVDEINNKLINLKEIQKKNKNPFCKDRLIHTGAVATTIGVAMMELFRDLHFNPPVYKTVMTNIGFVGAIGGVIGAIIAGLSYGISGTKRNAMLKMHEEAKSNINNERAQIVAQLKEIATRTSEQETSVKQTNSDDKQ